MLWGRSANRCTICRVELVVNRTDTDDESLIGDECHIIAKEITGSRGTTQIDEARRDYYENLILLCKNHHKQVDDQPDKFTVEKLHEIKRNHESWINSSLATFNEKKQREDEIYAGYIEEWAKQAELDRWQIWTSGFIHSDQPALQKDKYEQLRKLLEWNLSRVWPKRYPELENAFFNFQLVLNELLGLFDKHSMVIHEKVVITKKFYHIESWDPEQYQELFKEYSFHVALLEDLMLELSRSANYLCDMVREYIFPSFRIEEGIILIRSGPYMDCDYVVHRVEYRGEERKGIPYPGLKEFETKRLQRDMHFG